MQDRVRPVRRSVRSRDAAPNPTVRVGASAAQGATRCRSYQVGAIPLVNQILQRLRLETVLGEQLPAERSTPWNLCGARNSPAATPPPGR